MPYARQDTPAFGIDFSFPTVEHIEYAAPTRIMDDVSLWRFPNTHNRAYNMPPSEGPSTPPYSREVFARPELQLNPARTHRIAFQVPYSPPLHRSSNMRDETAITAQPVRPIIPRDRTEFVTISPMSEQEQLATSPHRMYGNTTGRERPNIARYSLGHPKVLRLIENDYGMSSRKFDILDAHYRKQDDHHSTEGQRTTGSNQQVQSEPHTWYDLERRSTRLHAP